MPVQISICMPHLNSRPFTAERMETILRQTLRDWELIIIDSGSDDGSLAILEEYAHKDPRIRIAQAPRDGIYRNLNRALELANGKYVYIATSDDTMAPDCLEKMAGALEQNPDCGLCHCCLEIIDESGKPVDREYAWDNYVQQNYFGEWTHKRHVRQAPHDGLLHFGFFTVYTSLTQLLVRRRVFEQLGVFRTDCNSYADFEWGMRVALNESVIHVPLKLATWRRHGAQATRPVQLERARARGEFRRLARNAVQSLDGRNSRLARALKRSSLNDYYLVDEMKARAVPNGSGLSAFAGRMSFAARHPLFSLRWLFCKVVCQRAIVGDFGEAVRKEFQRLGIRDSLRELEASRQNQAKAMIL